MTHAAEIAKMEAELAAKGISVAALCKEAGIAPTTWWRWKRTNFYPSFRTWQAVIEAHKALISASPETQGAAT